MAIQWLLDDPLARVPGESQRANRALREYAQQPAGQRSARRLAAEFRTRAVSSGSAQLPPSQSYTTIERWSFQNEWQARVARYDTLEAERFRQARAAADAVEIAKWAQRRQEIREREWTQAQSLSERATAMMRTPLFRTETEDGRNVIMPARWDWADVPRIADTASKLARLAAEMPTSRDRHEFEDMTDADVADTLASEIADLIELEPGGETAEPGPGADQGPGAGDRGGEDPLPPVA